MDEGDSWDAYGIIILCGQKDPKNVKISKYMDGCCVVCYTFILIFLETCTEIVFKYALKFASFYNDSRIRVKSNFRTIR